MDGATSEKFMRYIAYIKLRIQKANKSNTFSGERNDSEKPAVPTGGWKHEAELLEWLRESSAVFATVIFDAARIAS